MDLTFKTQAIDSLKFRQYVRNKSKWESVWEPFTELSNGEALVIEWPDPATLKTTVSKIHSFLKGRLQTTKAEYRATVRIDDKQRIVVYKVLPEPEPPKKRERIQATPK